MQYFVFPCAHLIQPGEKGGRDVGTSERTSPTQDNSQDHQSHACQQPLGALPSRPLSFRPPSLPPFLPLPLSLFQTWMLAMPNPCVLRAVGRPFGCGLVARLGFADFPARDPSGPTHLARATHVHLVIRGRSRQTATPSLR